MKRILLIVLLIPLLSACEKFIFQEEKQSTDPFENFDHLWTKCDKKYSFFEYKNIDWDQIRTRYRAKLYQGMSRDSLFKVMGGMLTELRDDHANLVSDFNVSYYGVENTGPDNFDWRIIEDHYLPNNYYTSGPFRHAFIAGDSIAYVRLSSFPGTVDNANLNFIMNRYQNTRGIIFDIRDNGGGRISDIYNILNRFVYKKTKLYYSRIKSGPEHNDFSSLKPVYVNSASNKRYHQQVIVLADRGTFSAGSFTALAAKAIPRMKLMGDTTGGGLGIPSGGQLPNGWTYRFSVTQTFDLNYNNFENGVPPDIYAIFNWNDRNTDEILEKAIQEINTGN